MDKNIRQWGKRDMLFYCPINKIVWQYDGVGKIHKHKGMPSYGLKRKEIEEKSKETEIMV